MIKFRQKKLVLGLILLTFFLISNCQNNDSTDPIDDNVPKWESLGFEDKLALRLRLYKPYLYVCAGSDGLWRRDIESENSDWEYFGLADTSLGHYLNRGVMDVLVNSENSDIMLAAFQPDLGAAHGVFKTEDGGDTWFASDSGLEFHFPPPWDDETYYEHPTIFLQTTYDLFAAGTMLVHSNDFGESWEVIMSINAPVATMETYAFRFYNDDPEKIWLGGENVYFSPWLMFSHNNGNTWDYVPLETLVTTDNAVYSIAFDPNNSDIVYVGMQREIIKTIDGGNSWISLSYEDVGYFRCIVEDNTQPERLFASRGHTTIETENGGVSWIDLESPNDGVILSMVYDSEEKALYIGTGSWPTQSRIFVYK